MIQKDRDLERYILEHTKPEDSLLVELDHVTHLRTVQPRMLSGHLQGVVLEMISKMVKPYRILEIGTFTGYSAICLAKGLATGGILHTIEVDDEMVPIAQEYFDRSEWRNCIKQHVGSALHIVPMLGEEFDLVFIDGDKREYIEYYNTVLPFVKTGGFILADNVLWDGKVLEKDPKDAQTKGIVDFNQYVNCDSAVENVLLPFRDGLMLLRKLD
ncbi:O-methyltransferase [Williamwhitmania taraxaci]|uniref:Predicted O-methyltransferase YrrM n=1 Tax=Williamwhitmania taraxaci TaxID=1640674 RepID=A0A1G6IUG2_9BACT|nr:O-methyltransferase [Williamwhitmania taraxaci]SDC09665.1 Predicted O-methyltransferase YrrM [Williamwhitmania taraxaci]